MRTEDSADPFPLELELPGPARRGKDPYLGPKAQGVDWTEITS